MAEALTAKQMAALEGTTVRAVQRKYKDQPGVVWVTGQRGGGKGGKQMLIPVELLPEGLQERGRSGEFTKGDLNPCEEGSSKHSAAADSLARVSLTTTTTLHPDQAPEVLPAGLSGPAPSSTGPLARKRLPAAPTAGSLSSEGLASYPKSASPSSSTALVPMPKQRSLLLPAEGERELAGLEEWQIRRALTAYRAIEPLLASDGSRKQVRGFSELVAQAARATGTSPGTIWRWLRLWCAAEPGQKWQALGPRYKGNRGQPRTLTEGDCAFVAREFLRNQNARAAWRALRRNYAGQRAPSYCAVRRYLRYLPEGTRVRAHTTEKRFEETQLPVIHRRYDDLAPNDIWVLDHSQFDDAVNAFNQVAFPWQTTIEDAASRYIVGAVISLQPNRHTIAAALRMAIRRFGRPRAIYCDWGKDFQSRYLTGRRLMWSQKFHVELPEQTRAVFADLCIGLQSSSGQVRKIIRALGYHAQSKPIERFFQTCRRQFDCTFDSYRGRKADQRTDGVDALIIEHERDRKHSPLIPLPLFALAYSAWLETEYHRNGHSGHGMNGRSPAAVYRPEERVGLDTLSLDLLLLEKTQRIIDRCEIRLFGHYYQSPALYRHNGHTAQVAFDPLGYLLPDLSEIVVTCCGERFLVPCTPLMSMKDVDYAELQRRLKERAQLKRQVEQGLAAEMRLSTPAWLRWAESFDPANLPEELLRPCLPAAREAVEKKEHAQPMEYTNESAAALRKFLQ